MPQPIYTKDPLAIEKDHSACGVGLAVTIPRQDDTGFLVHRSYQLVVDGLKTLGAFEYRSGTNPVTDENDGAGIKLYGLDPVFFSKKIAQGQFLSPTGERLPALTLNKGGFVIGHYFLPTDLEQCKQAKQLITEQVMCNGLMVVGWRDMSKSINPHALSANAREKMPAIWQSLLLPKSSIALDFIEQDSLQSAVDIIYAAREAALPIHILSLSSESIVYKGMVPPKKLGAFYLDLQHELLRVSGTAVHARFATNTDPQWANAQPCPFFWLHNGELTSAPSNAMQMQSQLEAHAFQGVFPNEKLSDSVQADADIANQMLIHNCSMIEAIVRLMPPAPSAHYSDGVNAMLQWFRLKRTPYNGPMFAVAASNGYYLACLDQVGLRPSRFAILEDDLGNRQFHAASDDYLSIYSNWKPIQKGHLEPGGMIMLTPQGKLLRTEGILEWVHAHYQPTYFQEQLKSTLYTLPPDQASLDAFLDSSEPLPLNPVDHYRLLYSAGWDHETETQVVEHMSKHGMERIAAMGDDTNPLHLTDVPVHLSYFFHQLFAQVSAPPLDSIKERARFSLAIALGATPYLNTPARALALESPILAPHQLQAIADHAHVLSAIIDITFEKNNEMDASALLQDAIKQLVTLIELKINQTKTPIIILSDSFINEKRIAIPDLIAVAAVRRHLEQKQLIHHVALVADSNQLTGPHQAAALLAMGAKAVYPRAAYTTIALHDSKHAVEKQTRYRQALEKCLLKTMGKLGITDVNNYINGRFLAALGLDLSKAATPLEIEPTLAAIFSGMYSPLKGIQLGHIANGIVHRHAEAYDPEKQFSLLPRAGYYMSEKTGIKHGYGPVVVNAFTAWMKAEDLRFKQWQMQCILARQGITDFIDNPAIFSAEKGFILSNNKVNGTYPADYLDTIMPSDAFITMATEIDRYNQLNPTTISHYFRISAKGPAVEPSQSKTAIRSLLFSGSMSQGALTVADPDKPDKRRAHETLTMGMNAIGAMSASGEGGESAIDLSDPITSTKSKQIASGRFGISALQILAAEEIEIKMAQGAKPGEGGEVPGFKISIRFAAQRGGLPGTPFISPPPHHDIYSIEDLEQLIHDIKSVKPTVMVAVKLVSSVGIGTIAVGVVKAGADVINIAGNSGGTGAAQQSSIKHAGLPAELGIAEVDKTLRQAKLRDLVQLRTSGGFKTANDVLIAASLGADMFEFGTTAMLTLGCKMQRTCNHSCQPGVAADGHLFQGDQRHTERYFVYLAAAIHQRLGELGFTSLSELRGRTDRLTCDDPLIQSRYDFSALLDRTHLPPPLSLVERHKTLQKRQSKFIHEKEAALCEKIQSFFDENPSASVICDGIYLTTDDRSFGARIAGTFAPHLKRYPLAEIVLHTIGNAGQSFGVVLPDGIRISHQGVVQDGCGKSMSGGYLALITHYEEENYLAINNTIAGNAMLYGASGGHVFVNGNVGHRFGILLKGAEVVVEGVGDFAFEYMTSGTALILGSVGQGLCTGASGGIVMVYNPLHAVQADTAVRQAHPEERLAYTAVISAMLAEQVKYTGSQHAKNCLEHFNINDFSVLIPKQLDNITTIEQVIDIIKTYELRKRNLTRGMLVWLEQTALRIASMSNPTELNALCLQLSDDTAWVRFSPKAYLKLRKLNAHQTEALDRDVIAFKKTTTSEPVHTDEESVIIHPLASRLSRIDGQLDTLFRQELRVLLSYVQHVVQDAKQCNCRSQSCAGGENVDTGCPSGKPINSINAALKQIGPIHSNGLLSRMQWHALRMAFELQIEATPFIGYTGAACPAPCQDACTETIPLAGEAVSIKEIEHHLYHIGSLLGWFDGQKEWTSLECRQVFGQGTHAKQDYDEVMAGFKAPFQPRHKKHAHHELIIVGSGPAGMQLAYKALRDGINVRMYEKSSRPGGLLMDGIPAHKFDKRYLTDDFNRLKRMGLELHLESHVAYNPSSGEYTVNGMPVAHRDNEHQVIALCIGTGQPKTLPEPITAGLSDSHRDKIIQAVDFLKAANDIADTLQKNPSLNETAREAIIQARMGSMDPRGKKIVVIGGGDTAQDVTRWVARYFMQAEDASKNGLTVLARGPDTPNRGLLDAYPSPSRAATKENALRNSEVAFINGTAAYLVEPKQVEATESGQLTLTFVEYDFKYHAEIQADASLKQLSAVLPREMRPLDRTHATTKTIHNVDMIICALGFHDSAHTPIIEAINEAGVHRVVIAGDASGVESNLIVGAQTNATNTYKQIRGLFGMSDRQVLASQGAGFFAKKASNAADETRYPKPSHIATMAPSQGLF